jgi:hypothetical protein
MLQCEYALPARQKIAAMQQEGKPDNVILASLVKEGGLSALAEPPQSGFNLLGLDYAASSRFYWVLAQSCSM